ncbi:MAG: hypothetical protein AB7U82_27565 [Blastocatellales bacterium]
MQDQILIAKLKADESLVLALRPEQAAASIGVSLPFLKQEMKAGKIKGVRKGRGLKKVVLVPVKELVAYLDSGDDPTGEQLGNTTENDQGD